MQTPKNEKAEPIIDPALNTSKKWVEIFYRRLYSLWKFIGQNKIVYPCRIGVITMPALLFTALFEDMGCDSP